MLTSTVWTLYTSSVPMQRIPSSKTQARSKREGHPPNAVCFQNKAKRRRDNNHEVNLQYLVGCIGRSNTPRRKWKRLRRRWQLQVVLIIRYANAWCCRGNFYWNIQRIPSMHLQYSWWLPTSFIYIAMGPTTSKFWRILPSTTCHRRGQWYPHARNGISIL